MDKITRLKKEFIKCGGVLKTSELRAQGFSSRQIKSLLENNLLSKIKHGFYELADSVARDEVIIARLFPKAVIFLESALTHYQYTDRMPSSWQIAVDKNSNKFLYDIDYPLITPYYLEPKFLPIGVDIFFIDKIATKIYNRERTICDVLRYEKKMEAEVFNNAIKNYVKDHQKNLRKLFEYAEILNIKNKVQTYLGVWL